MKRWSGLLVLILIVAGAFVLRLPHLSQRPLHTDESVHAIKFLGLWERGVYKYDPHEYHGPSLYYATLPFVWLSGAKDAGSLTEAPLRAVPLFFGLLLVLAPVFWLRQFGWGPVLGGALLTALSPAMVYYSRYYIHELLFVWFTAVWLAGCWRLVEKPGIGAAVVAGLGFGLMHATKETFVFCVVAVVGAAGSLVLFGGEAARQEQGGAGGSAAGRLGNVFGTVVAWVRSQRRWLALAFVVWVAVAVVLFSSFFTNARGPLDSILTYLPWLKRAGGASPHVHPWTFYFERFFWFHTPKGPVWTEAAIGMLAVVGGLAAWLGKGGLDLKARRLGKFLGLYTLFLGGIYTLLSYKTPWCALGFWQPAIVLAGLGCGWLWRVAGGGFRKVLLVCAAVAGAHLGWEAWRAAFVFPADRNNPYVYAHTSNDLLRLVDKVEGLASSHPDGYGMLLHVMAPDGDYWPLPWYLRKFKNVGWWTTIPSNPYAPVMIVGSKFEAGLDDRSGRKWIMNGLFEHRPKAFFELYVNLELWKKYLVTHPPKPDPDE